MDLKLEFADKYKDKVSVAEDEIRVYDFEGRQLDVSAGYKAGVLDMKIRRKNLDREPFWMKWGLSDQDQFFDLLHISLERQRLHERLRKLEHLPKANISYTVKYLDKDGNVVKAEDFSHSIYKPNRFWQLNIK